MDLPEVTFTVDLLKGTYIRTLCHDIGQKLGCGGAMKELTVQSRAVFRRGCHSHLDQIEELAREGQSSGILSPPVEGCFLTVRGCLLLPYRFRRSS